MGTGTPLSCLLPNSLLFNMERCINGWMDRQTDGWLAKYIKDLENIHLSEKKITYPKMVLSGEKFTLCTLYSFLFHDHELLKHKTIHKSTKSTKTIKTCTFWKKNKSKNLKKKCSSKLESTPK